MKTVLITGANRGIGLETARQMGKLGFRVIVAARDVTAAEKTANTLTEEGITSDFVVIDVNSEESVRSAAAEVAKKTNGVLDVLINNTGIMVPNGVAPGSTEVDLEAVRKCFETNTFGTVRMGNHFVEFVKAAPAGRIVNLSSIMGSLTLAPSGLETFAYNASKTALNMYTVNLAHALKDTNVKVNSAHPGWVRTDMGGSNAQLPVEEGAETSVYLATLPDDGPTGGFFSKKDTLAW